MINLINVEEPLRNALEIIGWYCKHNNCNTCSLRINENTCLTDKDPDAWWRYLNAYHNDEPQVDYKKWDALPRVSLPTGEITTCVSVLASAFKEVNHKTEPQANCHTCKYDISEDDNDLYDMCETMVEGECRYEPIDKPQTVSLTSAHISGDIYHRVEDKPQTERHLPDYSYEADLGRRIMEQMKGSE